MALDVALALGVLVAIYFAVERFRVARMLAKWAQWPSSDLRLLGAEISAEEWAGLALCMAAIGALVTLAVRL